MERAGGGRALYARGEGGNSSMRRLPNTALPGIGNRSLKELTLQANPTDRSNAFRGLASREAYLWAVPVSPETLLKTWS
jgi:hypothetical protein